ncbi:ABC-three component system protein [Maribacter halichondriae]|uniref:ABC-three component system protein n=1 Tax=Maribacter halichondriae TaxID=2980554 RepID=UPI0023593927|nr:ABC-three component system protein [Maribacter sp. Hal144]
MSKKVEQSNISTDSGDVVAGNKTISEKKGTVKISQIRRLFRDLSREYDNEEKIKEICVELNDYDIERDVIGLDAKLIEAGSTQNYIEDAEVLKQRFSKKLYHYNEYQSAQRIFVIMLAQVSELFRAKILPKLNDGRNVTDLDNDIYNEIIKPLNELLNKEASEDNVLYISSQEIRGMLYYLTGRCHIKWVA